MSRRFKLLFERVEPQRSAEPDPSHRAAAARVSLMHRRLCRIGCFRVHLRLAAGVMHTHPLGVSAVAAAVAAAVAVAVAVAVTVVTRGLAGFGRVEEQRARRDALERRHPAAMRKLRRVHPRVLLELDELHARRRGEVERGNSALEALDSCCVHTTTAVATGRVRRGGVVLWKEQRSERKKRESDIGKDKPVHGVGGWIRARAGGFGPER
eukprot:6043801-Pleurochrysis_carterae.AAC.1